MGSIQRAMGAWQDAAPGGDLKWVTDQKQTSSSSVPTGDWCWGSARISRNEKADELEGYLRETFKC